MPNAVNYNVSAQTQALKKGNFWIATGDVGKGSGYWNGLTQIQWIKFNYVCNR